MWEKKRVRIPPGLQPVTCSTVAAHPWVFSLGQAEPSGFYLSPPNAVDYLAGRLAGANSHQDTTVIMLTAPTLPAFVSRLAPAAAVLPIPVLSQVLRRAHTAVGLATSRMQIPASPGGLPAAVPLSISTIRAAQGAQVLQQAAADAGVAGSVQSIAAALASFKANRAQALAQAGDLLQQVQGGSFTAWVVSATDNTQTAIARMRDGIPDADATFTLALMFVGEDLAPLRAMVTDQ